MRCSIVFWFALFSASGATAALPGSQVLAVDYTEPLPSTVSQIATDGSGAVYILANCEGVTTAFADCVIKLSPDGKTVQWQDSVGFGVQIMTVDPTGGVAVVAASRIGDLFIYVAKLAPGGAGVAWKTAVTPVSPGLVALAADSAGRVFVAGSASGANSNIVALNPTGDAFDYMATLPGFVQSIAVDATGSAYVAGLLPPFAGFLARITADGSIAFSIALPSQTIAIADVQATPAGTASVYATLGSQSAALWRYDTSGALTSSIPVPSGQFALDQAGNAYILGGSQQLFPARNSLSTCAYPPSSGGYGGGSFLAIFAPDGSVLQWTYLPVAATFGSVFIGGASPYVFLGGSAAFGFTPTQSSPIPGSGVLVRLSPSASPLTYPLACLGNSADYNIGAISPGDIVTLYGNGLGPEQGIQTTATLQDPYPTQAGGLQVTFDGTPAPLLWVQDSQINVVAPWSLTAGNTTQVCVNYNAVKTNCLAWPVAQTDPGVYMVDATYAAALNQDGSINSADNPAPPGSAVTVFANGLGPITPPQPDGALVGPPAPTDALPVQVVGFLEEGMATVPFDLTETNVGQALFMVAGASEVSFRVSADYPGPYALVLPGAIFGPSCPFTGCRTSQTFCVYQKAPVGQCVFPEFGLTASRGLESPAPRRTAR